MDMQPIKKAGLCMGISWKVHSEQNGRGKRTTFDLLAPVIEIGFIDPEGYVQTQCNQCNAPLLSVLGSSPASPIGSEVYISNRF
jgi:hypothetical protein